MSSKAKKYKLFAATDADGSKRQCAFFLTPQGCNKGDSCPFLHSTAAPETPLNTNNSVVSSEMSSEESEGEIEEPKVKQTPKVKQEKTAEPSSSRSKKNKRKRDDDGQVFAKPKGQVITSKYTDMLDDDGAGVKRETPSATPPAQASSPKQKKTKKSKETKPAAPASSGSFRTLDLPIADFMLPFLGVKKVAVKQEEAPAPTPAPAPKPPKSKYPLPVSSEIGRKWKDVVVKTHANIDFASIFDFKKYKDQDIPGDVWVKSKPFGEWCSSNPQSIAIDCEMCETKDPVSGQKNHSALCRISVVNAEDPEDVLLNTLVKPAWPVTDYRTFVNGITKEHLEPVQFTLRHAQAFLMALCSEETVILGHAVHNDVAALRFEHYCVGDSALLFTATDSPTATVSLKDLALNILKKDMPATHDSVNDAVTAMKCLDHYREKKGDVEEIVRTPKQRDATNRTHHKLFVHRIPKFCKATHLAKMFLEHTSIAPDDVDEIEFVGNKGKTHVIFKTPRHAGLVFDTLTGTGEKEGSGRLQKKVWLRDGDYVQVRKMAFEKGHQFPDGKEAK